MSRFWQIRSKVQKRITHFIADARSQLTRQTSRLAHDAGLSFEEAAAAANSDGAYHAAWITRSWLLRQHGLSMDGARVVFCVHSGFLSHSGRVLRLGEEFARLGAEVWYVCDIHQRYASLFPQERIYHSSMLPWTEVNRFSQEKNSWGFYRQPTLGEHTNELIQVLGGLKPDVVVADFCPQAKAACLVCGTPLVSILNFTWTDFCGFRVPLPEHHPRLSVVEKYHLLWLIRAIDWLTPVMDYYYAKRMQPLWARPYNEVRRSLGLPEEGTYLAHTQGDLILMPDYPNIPGLNQHESAYAVGPIIWEPVACANDESRRFLSQRQAPLVYISMGSTGSLQLFQSLLQALEQVPEIDAFITTGGQFPEWFDSLPPRENVHIANIYPGSEVLTCPDVLLRSIMVAPVVSTRH